MCEVNMLAVRVRTGRLSGKTSGDREQERRNNAEACVEVNIMYDDSSVMKPSTETRAATSSAPMGGVVLFPHSDSLLVLANSSCPSFLGRASHASPTGLKKIKDQDEKKRKKNRYRLSLLTKTGKDAMPGCRPDVK